MPPEIASTPTLDTRALALLPLPDRLTAEQARGAACVWCGSPLTTEAAVPLGDRPSPAGVRQFPRACRPCTGPRAYSALLDHAPGCEECCASAPGCTIGHTLNRLIRQGRR
ncbi:hypothetical protein BJY54_002172 [Streptomyces nodosus]|uniref:Uncharacterized protein n=1 Tax=Streptomyces nodosus TaxID=40318 RepID=A0A5P2VZL5_9ACTN|nr:hypothetical protein [Streptomyces nodosus]QEV39074.1 hypothetical protein CP978_11320 [Streptomyces nodosus]